MANFVSPGVYVIEKDISDYTPAVNPTVVGIVGFASKGPTNKATLITSQENLVKTFGRPQEALAGQGLEGGLEILETANQTYFVRAVAETGANAASAVMPMGSCPAMLVSGVGAGIGVDQSCYLKVQITDSAGRERFAVPKSFAIPAGTMAGGQAATTQDVAMKSVIGGNMDTDEVGVYFTSGTTLQGTEDGIGSQGSAVYLVANYAGSGASLAVSAYSDSNYSVGLSGILHHLTTSGARASLSATQATSYALKTNGYSFNPGARLGSDNTFSSIGYLTESLYPGTGYNTSTLADGSILGNSITVSPLGSKNFTVNVNDGGIAEEGFKASFVASGNYLEDVINTGATDLKSETIKGNLILEDSIFSDAAIPFYESHLSALTNSVTQVSGHGGGYSYIGYPVGAGGTLTTTTSATVGDWNPLSPRFIKLVDTTVNLAGGTNGDGDGDTDKEADALIGQATPTRTGMQALNDELVPITLAIVPGISDQRVQNALITLAETTGNFLAVFGCPIGIGNPGDAIEYANGQTPYRNSAFNSSYACLYYPAVKVFQSYMAKDIWMDPAIFAVRQMGFTDSVAELWFAPAGFVRGRLTKPFDTEVDINQGDRDSLYSGGNIVNPIVNFPLQGITIFGQRTTQRAPTALDRINVRRLMVFIKRVITMSTQRFIFEPNDKITQERIQTLLVPLFEDIKRRRGVTEFKVICDETVNTPVRVDRNELWCKILIKPTKAAEVLIFELNITNQSANIG